MNCKLHLFIYLVLCSLALAEQDATAPEKEQDAEAPDPNVFYIDRMDHAQNSIKGRCAPYFRPPSKILVTKGPAYGKDGAGLKLAYNQINVGGPYGKGGWCGYYTVLKRGDKYFDASHFTHLTFWVRGEEGQEEFQVGVADKQFGMIEDSVKSKPVGSYMPSNQITTEWQKVEIPLNDMFVDYHLVDTISINFESDLFDAEEISGTVYIDNMAFERIEENGESSED